MDGSKVDWFVYLGHPKLQYPTYSPSITHEQFRLESKTESFITFSLEQETVLKHRGIFQSRKYCVEKTNQEAVNCYKDCFLKSLKVFLIGLSWRISFHQTFFCHQIPCQPSAVNTFDELNLTACNETEDEAIMNILFNKPSLTPKFKCDCLDPCSQFKYKFYVNNICLFCCVSTFDIFHNPDQGKERSWEKFDNSEDKCRNFCSNRNRRTLRLVSHYV